MDQRVALLFAVAITITAIWTGWSGLLFVAVCGALLTVGFRTGSLAPMCPELTRNKHPIMFWSLISFAGLVVAVSLIRLSARL